MTMVNGLYLGDVTRLRDNSIDGIVARPRGTLESDFWCEALRVVKPGAHLVVFAGPLGHRMTCAVEDAGWQIRDSLMWLRGDGYEAMPLAMKPLDGTFAANALKWGVAGLNIDGSRVETSSRPLIELDGRKETNGTIFSGRQDGSLNKGSRSAGLTTLGRWPPNVLLSHTVFCGDDECAEDCPVVMLDQQSGITKSTGGGMNRSSNTHHVTYARNQGHPKVKNCGKGDLGGASRFFPRFNRFRDVVAWIVKLIAPPIDPVIIDPFGSLTCA